MADISNLKINKRANVEQPNLRELLQQKMKFISNGKYGNRQNCEWCGISNGRTIPKFANFLNFDNFPN